MSKNAKKVISSIVERLKEKYKPEKIILYGSFAYGKPNRDSDIDILIIKSAKERPIDRRIMVRRIVTDLRKGYPFSPIVITPDELSQRLKIGDQFLQEIISQGRLLYGK